MVEPAQAAGSRSTMEESLRGTSSVESAFDVQARDRFGNRLGLVQRFVADRPMHSETFARYAMVDVHNASLELTHMRGLRMRANGEIAENDRCLEVECGPGKKRCASGCQNSDDCKSGQNCQNQFCTGAACTEDSSCILEMGPLSFLRVEVVGRPTSGSQRTRNPVSL